MATTEFTGITVNKMSLEKYREVKNTLDTNDINTFNDIDEYVHTYKESLDTVNPIILRNLDTGLYKIYGYFRYYSGQSGISAVDPFAFIIIEKGSTYSYATIISSNEINQYKITNSSYENLNDSGWITATLTSDFQGYSGNSANAPQYRKLGSTIEIRGAVSPTSELAASNTGVTIFTLPTGYRPTKNVYEICQGSNKNVWLLTITSGGNVQISRYGTTTNINVPVNAWLTFNKTFTIN